MIRELHATSCVKPVSRWDKKNPGRLTHNVQKKSEGQLIDSLAGAKSHVKRLRHSPTLWDNSQAPTATQTNNNDATRITTYRLSRYIARTLTHRIQELCMVITGTFQLRAHRRNIINPTTWIPTAVIAPSYRTKCSHLCTCQNALKFRIGCLTSTFLV